MENVRTRCDNMLATALYEKWAISFLLYSEIFYLLCLNATRTRERQTSVILIEKIWLSNNVFSRDAQYKYGIWVASAYFMYYDALCDLSTQNFMTQSRSPHGTLCTYCSTLRTHSHKQTEKPYTHSHTQTYEEHTTKIVESQAHE